MATEVPTQSLRAQQRAFTRERLLQGASEVFGTQGYVNATIDDIVASAGASRATFYLHFSSKKDVIVELSARQAPTVRAFYQELDEVLEENSREALEEWIRRALDWMLTEKHVIVATVVAHIVEGGLDGTLPTDLVKDMPKLLARTPKKQHRQLALRIGLLSVNFRAALTFHPDALQQHPDELVDTLADVWANVLLPVTK